MQHIAFIKILEICTQSLVKKDIIDLLKAKLILLTDELDKWDLVERVNVVYSASEVPQKPDESELSAGRSIEERSRTIDVQYVAC